MPRARLIIACVVTSILSVSAVLAIMDSQITRNKADLRSMKSRLAWVTETADRLVKGGSTIEMYGIAEPDNLLEAFAGNTNVSKVVIEQSGIGMSGMVAIGRMPSVRLVAILDESMVTDQMLLNLERCESLEEVHLRRIGVSNACIQQLSKLPSLRHLTLEDMPEISRGTVADARSQRPDLEIEVDP